MKLAIIGATGLLGSNLYRISKKYKGIEPIGTYHNHRSKDLEQLDVGS